ncbi:MAG: IS1380 family transposase, partial [Desulfurivibrionaceae bacterium]|nr:IS1380 family transposase [Desulfurivibrionaceae bacterium]
QLVLGKEWKPKRLKAIRFWLVNLPGRVVEHARRLSVKLSGRHPSFDLLLEMRAKILKLKPVPI